MGFMHMSGLKCKIEPQAETRTCRATGSTERPEWNFVLVLHALRSCGEADRSEPSV